MQSRLYTTSWSRRTQLNIYLPTSLFTDLSMLPFFKICALSLHWMPQLLLPLHGSLLATSSISLWDLCWATLRWAAETAEPSQIERFSTCRIGTSGQLYRNAPHLFAISCNWGVKSELFSLKDMIFTEVERMQWAVHSFVSMLKSWGQSPHLVQVFQIDCLCRDGWKLIIFSQLSIHFMSSWV